MAEPTKVLRCAVYTRKSSDEGLEQEFNSLHAQRESCEAYIASQKHEGWQLLPTAYDDGGFSGGSMVRPGLKQLLQDIKAKLIDVVVVYKVDRLTRSLADFAKMVEVFDGHGVSFVSVTQAFSTTTSMGRLTLNVLLSFAQFEREVTGERIRDKIAASKAKGMWMGGVTPLGYDVVDRKLVVNASEAEDVRTLFELYRKSGSADDVVEQAWAQGIRSKARVSALGVVAGRGRILRGALYGILANPIYVGEIGHKDKRYPGQHEAIVSKPLFKAVQAQLDANRRRRKFGSGAAETGLLCGLVFGPDGGKLTSHHTKKKGRRYRYYVGASDGDAPPFRAPAHQLEKHVVDALREILASQNALLTLLSAHPLPDNLAEVLNVASKAAAQLGKLSGPPLRGQLLELVARIVVLHASITVELNGNALKIGANPSLTIDARVSKIRGELALVLPSKKQAEPDAALVSLVAQARTWFDLLASSKVPTIRALARTEKVSEGYVRRVANLALMAPDLTMMILEGRQPANLSATKLKQMAPLPMEWAMQRELFAALG